MEPKTVYRHCAMQLQVFMQQEEPAPCWLVSELINWAMDRKSDHLYLGEKTMSHCSYAEARHVSCNWKCTPPPPPHILINSEWLCYFGGVNPKQRPVYTTQYSESHFTVHQFNTLSSGFLMWPVYCYCTADNNHGEEIWTHFRSPTSKTENLIKN